MTTFAGRLSAATVVLACLVAVKASADSTPQSLPFSQDWSNTELITTDDDWSGVPGIVGCRGDNLTSGNDVDPQTVLDSDTPCVIDVNANSAPTSSTGGVLEVVSGSTDAPTIGLAGSGTADAPYILINLDTSGRSDIAISYGLFDLDASADDAVQQFALHYRVGSSGSFTNVAAGYVADATTAGSATQTTSVSAVLPADADDEPLVQVRVMTTNAGGADELTGVDNILVTGTPIVVLPALSINDASIAEGDGGTSLLSFTVTADIALAANVDFSYDTADGTATTADNDYVGVSGGTGTILAGETSTTIEITINGDTTIEGPETFSVTLSNPMGATISDGTGIGTIDDDDAADWIINEVMFRPDTNSLAGDANGDGVVVTTQDQFVEIINNSGSTQDISGWEFYRATFSRHTFPPGTSIPDQCAIVVFGGGSPTGRFGNATVQTASFGNLGLIANATLQLRDGATVMAEVTYDSQALGPDSVTRDPDIYGSAPPIRHGTATGSGGALFSPGLRIDGSQFSGCPELAPLLVVDDVSLNEGNAGTTTFTFTVSLDKPAGVGGVSFDYSTADGSATTADSDYVAASNLPGSIAEGMLSTTFDIMVNGDTTIEGIETFDVLISNVVGADVGKGSGIGTIVGDDAPYLSVADFSQVEGDAGTSVFNVPVTLDGPANGDITFEYVTQDGTATTADNDYVGVAVAQMGTILSGQSSTTIPITVTGDTTLEDNETFSVIVSSVVNGNVADNTGVVTILRDDRYPIALIQGSEDCSPLWSGFGNCLASANTGANIDVAASIVTAIAYDTAATQTGFFIQTPDADVDMSPATSEGLHVASTIPVAVGDRVEVTGDVIEDFGLTGITNASVNVVSSGNALPTALVFGTATSTPSTDPYALSCPGSGPGNGLNADTNFECFEGMLVSIPEGIANQGNRILVDDDYAGLQITPYPTRALREQGTVFPNATTAANVNAGEWDGNPEVLEMDPDIARRGSGPIDTEIVGGASFSASGVIAYVGGDYEFWPTQLSIDDASNRLPRPVDPAMAASELRLGSFNLQSLCDDVGGNSLSPCDSPEPDGAALSMRLHALSAYIRDVLGSPDVVAVQEAENIAVLTLLAGQIQSDGGPVYTALLVEGNDATGLDLGYLVDESRVLNASATQHLGSEVWNDPECTPCAVLLHEHPPLLLQADFQSAPGAALFPFALLNNQTEPRGNVDGSNAAAQRTRAKRFMQAESIAALVQDFQTASGVFGSEGTDSVPLTLLGDYNAYAFPDGAVDALGVIAGTYDDDANTCSPANAVTDCLLGGSNIVDPVLQNLTISAASGERYSSITRENFGNVLGYRGAFGGEPGRDVYSGEALDHALVNSVATSYVSLVDFGRANIDASELGTGTGSGPDGAGGVQISDAIGSSDRDGLVAYLETNCANLTIAPGSEPDPDQDGVCSFADNCPANANAGQEDSNGNGVGDVCDAPPVAMDDGSFGATEDTMLTVVVPGVLGNDSDPEGDSLTASLVSAPATGNLTLNPDGSFSYLPAADFCDEVNPVTFTYVANDGTSDSNSATASILVACVDDPADAMDDNATVLEDSGVNAIDVLGNDVDPEGDAFEIVSVTFPMHGALTVSGSGSMLSYAPDADYCNDGAPTDDFTYTITGGDTATVSITITCVDDPAMAIDDSATVTEDDPATIIDVLANDLDTDGGVNLITDVTQPLNGVVSITNGGTDLSYTSNADYCNDGMTTDDFGYTVNGVNSATVSMTVTCVEDGPAQAFDDAANVSENSAGNLIDVLANDTPDPDDGTLTLDSVGTASNGVATIDSNMISYTPMSGYCGADSVDYTLAGGSSATVTISIACLAPEIFGDGFED